MVCYAILTPPALCSMLLFSQFLLFSDRAREYQGGGKLPLRYTMCRSERAHLLSVAIGAAERRGSDQTLVLGCRYLCFPDKAHVGHCARRRLMPGQEHVVIRCVTAVVPDQATLLCSRRAAWVMHTQSLLRGTGTPPFTPWTQRQNGRQKLNATI